MHAWGGVGDNLWSSSSLRGDVDRRSGEVRNFLSAGSRSSPQLCLLYPPTPLWSRDSVGREACPHIGPELLRLSVLIPCFSRLSCLLVWLVIGIFMSLSVCPPDSSVSASLRRGPQAVSRLSSSVCLSVCLWLVPLGGGKFRLRQVFFLQPPNIPAPKPLLVSSQCLFPILLPRVLPLGKPKSLQLLQEYSKFRPDWDFMRYEGLQTL